jgi:hypothetical protein
MGSRDRPGKEQKKKPKAKENKQPRLESLLQSPPQSVEVIKPKRKPRWEENESGSAED